MGRQCPVPENFSILDLKMATSGAFWAQFVYSSGACFVLHGKQCFYVKLNPADEKIALFTATTASERADADPILEFVF